VPRLVELVDAYASCGTGSTYRLLRDLGDHLNLGIAYVDRATIEAHLERTLSAGEWAAISQQLHAFDFDDHVDDAATFRTNWIETVLDKGRRARLRLHRRRRGGLMTNAASNRYELDLDCPSVTDDLATPEQIAELRCEELACLTLLHLASARLANLASYPHSRLVRATLDLAAEPIRSAEKLLRDLDDVLDPKQSPAGHELSARRLQQRVEHEQQTLKLALRQAG
jgi:hypothetical protein